MLFARMLLYTGESNNKTSAGVDYCYMPSQTLLRRDVGLLSMAIFPGTLYSLLGRSDKREVLMLPYLDS